MDIRYRYRYRYRYLSEVGYKMLYYDKGFMSVVQTWQLCVLSTTRDIKPVIPTSK